MLDVTVIENAAAAEASLDPIRSRLLAELATPGLGDDARAARSGCPASRSTTTSGPSSGTASSSSSRSVARAT